MAVGMLQAIPGGTKELYDQVNEKLWGGKMGADQAPDGLLMHSAGPSEGGWYVYDVWESKEHFNRFADNQLMPAVQQVAPDMMQQGAQPQFFEIENLVIAAK